MKKSHEQMMDAAWRMIAEIGITDDKEKAAADDSLYLVDDIYKVRDALYSDIEQGIEIEGEDLDGFMARHGISYK